MSASDDEEIRFSKKQEWYVATAGVTLAAAIFALADKLKPLHVFEKLVSVLALTAIAVFCFRNLRSLQRHIVEKRIKIEKSDDASWWRSRDADIMWTLVGVVVLSAVAVGYAIVCRM